MKHEHLTNVKCTSVEVVGSVVRISLDTGDAYKAQVLVDDIFERWNAGQAIAIKVADSGTVSRKG